MREQIASAQEWIQRHVPAYRPRTLALPMGEYPRDIRWATTGDVGGTTYRHDAILMVAGGAAPSPFSAAFDPYRLPRIQAVESEVTGWLIHFQQRPEDRYVSDGDPTAIAIRSGSAGKVRSRGGTRVVERP